MEFCTAPRLLTLPATLLASCSGRFRGLSASNQQVGLSYPPSPSPPPSTHTVCHTPDFLVNNLHHATLLVDWRVAVSAAAVDKLPALHHIQGDQLQYNTQDRNAVSIGRLLPQWHLMPYVVCTWLQHRRCSLRGTSHTMCTCNSKGTCGEGKVVEACSARLVVQVPAEVPI